MRRLISCIILLGIMIHGTACLAFTKPLEKNYEVSYPISLETGKDAEGNLLIEDGPFLSYLKNEVFYTGDYVGCPFDMDGDGTLSEAECDKVRIISIENREDIANISGIKAFPKLRELYCSGSGVKQLDLSGNSKLQVLHAARTKIKNVDLSNCLLLRDVAFNECQLSYLDVGTLNNLQELTCSYQKVHGHETIVGNKYQVDLRDWGVEPSRVANARIDGGKCDNINSTYDEATGVFICSDEMKEVSYDYQLDTQSNVEGIDDCFHVTMSLESGYRENYDTNGGNTLLPQYVTTGAEDVCPVAPKRTGYAFEGWYTTRECMSDSRWSFGKVLQGPLTLYANWNKKLFSVVYNLDGGTMQQEQKVVVDWWTDIVSSKLVYPEREGYVFDGWCIDGNTTNVMEPGQAVTYGELAKSDNRKEIQLTARWQEKSNYTLKYQCNLSANELSQVSGFPQNKKDISWYDDYLIPDMEPELRGYIFDGWYYDAVYSRMVDEKTTFCEIYTSQKSMNNAGYDACLYAHFIPRKYTVRYETGTKVKITSRKGIGWNDVLGVPQKKLKKKGYLFAGWQLVGGRKVNVGSRLSGVARYEEDSYIVKAMWYKKFEKRGTTFSRYGRKYKIVQSNSKGNKVVRVKGRKKNTPKYVVYNGVRFKVK